jgi:hypothetical protein
MADARNLVRVQAERSQSMMRVCENTNTASCVQQVTIQPEETPGPGKVFVWLDGRYQAPIARDNRYS